MKNILMIVAFVIALSMGVMGQDKQPKYIGGGFTLGQGNVQSTVAGGFIEGNYPFLNLFEFKGGMGVENNTRFGGGVTTITLAPEMRMFVPVSKDVEFFAGGGVDAQMFLNNVSDTVNPTATFGLRFAKKYSIRFTNLFDNMNGNGPDDFRGIRIGGDIFHPINDRFALIGGFDYDRQTAPFLPANQYKGKVGIAIK